MSLGGSRLSNTSYRNRGRVATGLKIELGTDWPVDVVRTNRTVAAQPQTSKT